MKQEVAAALLWLGLSPKEITGFQAVSLQNVLGYLDAMIGRGVIRRSDVFFSMPREQRGAVAKVDASHTDGQLTDSQVADRVRKQGCVRVAFRCCSSSSPGIV